MKKNNVILIFLLGILALSFQQKTSNEANWLLSIEEAKSLSIETGKPILLAFSGSDWCRPCIMLHQRVFTTDTFIQYTKENLILVKVDFPKKKESMLSETQQEHNNALAKKFNPSGQFPYNVIIDAEENEKGHFGFLGDPYQFINQLELLTKK
jgi:thioredoxin-related protein